MKKVFLGIAILIVIVAAGIFFVKKSQAPSVTPSLTSVPSPTTDPDNVYKDLPGIASCNLKGTIRYITPQTYNNGDALFTYRGVDHPGRNIFWKVTPSDKLDMGPNIFTQLALPEGTSLLSVTLPEHPVTGRYTVTASMQSGRLVNGNVKVSIIPCTGATTIIFP